MKPSCVLMVVMLVSSVSMSAQSAGQLAAAPTLVRLDGQLKTPSGEARTGTVAMVVSLYADKDAATPLWVEQQLVTLDAAGRYTLFAGATLPDGVPAEFLTGASSGQWLGVGVQGEAEQFRMMLVTVPYALKAREADTLSGKRLSDFVLTESLSEAAKASLKAAGVGVASASSTVPGVSGLAGALLRDNGAGGISPTDSVLVDDALGNVTVRPLGGLASKIRFWNAVGNNETVIRDVGSSGQSELVFEPGLNERLRIKSSGGADIYGNLLLRPLNGAASTLRLWNATSSNESYIRDAGTAGASALVFEPGAVERMRVTSTGNVGIGTSSPSSQLHVRGASPVRILGDTTTLSGTESVDFFARSSIFSSDLGGMRIQRQSPTGNIDTVLFAAKSGSSASENMRITGDGNVGIGTSTPEAKLHVEGGSNVGVLGQTVSGRGVFGNSSGSGIGVFGNSATGWAGYFSGNVNVTGVVCAANVSCLISDARLKENVTPLSYGLREVLRLRPVRWQWKDPTTTQLNLGLVAQEVEPVE